MKSPKKPKRPLKRVSNKNIAVRLERSGGDLLFELLKKHGTKKKVAKAIGKGYSTTRGYFANIERKDWGKKIPINVIPKISKAAIKAKIRRTYFPSLSFGDIANTDLISLDSLRIRPNASLLHLSIEVQYFKRDGSNFKLFHSKIYYAKEGKQEIERRFKEFVQALSGKPYIAYIKIVSFGVRQYNKGEAFNSKVFITHSSKKKSPKRRK